MPFQVTLGAAIDCPNITLSDTTDYTGVAAKYLKSNMGFVKLTVRTQQMLAPFVYASHGTYNKLINAAVWGEAYLTAMDGVVETHLKLVPAPVNTENYIPGDVIFFNEKFYIPNIPVVWGGVVTGDWTEVTEDAIPSQFESAKLRSIRCHSMACIKKSLRQAICAIEDTGNNSSLLCKDTRFTNAIQLLVVFYETYFGVTAVNEANKIYLTKVFNKLNKHCCKC